ncbi:hypothetical protein BCR42DRAFT_425918 [Absidia repens]|uniref:Uncharacterized protein n=1 Tax=Absidia repens TaxID=90262 RepID=A0A1X2I2A8_9FUNG|nr:hypothetical protein BCR42DRAFT_425918 [Absidia repens]
MRVPLGVPVMVVSPKSMLMSEQMQEGEKEERWLYGYAAAVVALVVAAAVEPELTNRYCHLLPKKVCLRADQSSMPIGLLAVDRQKEWVWK